MTSAIASVVFALFILGLLWLDRAESSRASIAVWIPVVWLFLACSRSVGQWLQMEHSINLSDQSDMASQVMEGSPIDRLGYGIVMVLGLIVLATRRRDVVALLKANGSIAVIFLYCALSFSWSDYPDVAFKRWIKAVGDLVMVLVVLSDRDPGAAVERLLSRLTCLMIPLSILVIKYYPYLGRDYDRWTGKVFYTGIAMNKNGLGVICLLCGLACAWRVNLAIQNRKGAIQIRQLLVPSITLMMVLWLFSIANSMTSLACFMIGITLLVAGNLQVFVRNPVAIHFLVVSILSVIITVLFLSSDTGILETMGKTSTLTDRTEIWPLLLTVGGDPMIGTGYESFWLGPRLQKIWSIYAWKPLEAHNGYLEMFLNLGWVGVALLAVFLATGYKKVIAGFRHDALIGSLMVAYFIGGVVYNFTEAAFFRMMAPVWIFILMSIVGASVLVNRNIRLPVSGGTHGERAPVLRAGSKLKPALVSPPSC